MILPEDIHKVVREALEAQAVFASGKAFPDRGPDAPEAYPYVIFTATPTDTLYDSGPKYHQYWRVTAAAYCSGYAPSIIDVLKGLHAALAVGPTTAPVVAALRNSGEAVLHSYVKDTGTDYEADLREGQDVLVATLEVELLALGLNNVA